MIRFKALRSSVYLKLYYIMTVFVCRQEVFFVHKTGLTKGMFEFLWNMDSMLYMIPVVIVLGLTGRRLTLAALFKCLLGYHIELEVSKCSCFDSLGCRCQTPYVELLCVSPAGFAATESTSPFDFRVLTHLHSQSVLILATSFVRRATWELGSSVLSIAARHLLVEVIQKDISS